MTTGSVARCARYSARTAPQQVERASGVEASLPSRRWLAVPVSAHSGRVPDGRSAPRTFDVGEGLVRAADVRLGTYKPMQRRDVAMSSWLRADVYRHDFRLRQPRQTEDWSRANALG